MKLTQMAMFITALAVVGAANAAEIYNQDGNKLDLYGKIGGVHYFSGDDGVNGDQSYVRPGIKGETKISDDLTGYGQWEYNLQAGRAEGDQQSWSRLAFAGLKSDKYGSFDYGRNYGVLYDVEAMTDMLPEFGGDSWSAPDNFMTGRASGVATWRNSSLVDGLNLALQYQAANGDKGELGRDIRHENGDGFGASATYDLGQGFGVGAAYSTSARSSAQKAAGAANPQFAGGNKADAWATGVKYDANNLYLATTYSQTRNMTPFGSASSAAGGGVANSTHNIEITAQYQMDSGLRPSISWLQSQGQQLKSADGDTKALVKYVDLATSYVFNKNMSAYVDYKINLLDGRDAFYRNNGIGTDNILATGLLYQF